MGCVREVFAASSRGALLHPFPWQDGKLLFLLLLSLSRSLSTAELSCWSHWRGALPSAHPAGTEKPGALGPFGPWAESVQNLFA